MTPLPEEALDREAAMAFLTADSGAVPCSRYGRDGESCAPIAYAVCEIIAEANGDPITREMLDHVMGLVVNDHDDPETLIREHGTPEHMALLEEAL